MSPRIDRLTVRLYRLYRGIAAIENLKAEEIKYNHYHDPLGRFTFAPGGGATVISVSDVSKTKPKNTRYGLQETIIRATFAPNRSAWVERVKLISPGLSDAEINTLFDQMIHKASLDGQYQTRVRALFDLQKTKVYVQRGNHKKLDYVVMSADQYQALHSLFKDVGTSEGIRAAAELENLNSSGRVRSK